VRAARGPRPSSATRSSLHARCSPEYDEALEDLRRLAAETSHHGTQLGTIRCRVEVITLRTQLQMALGLLPHDLADLALIIDGRRTAEAVLGILERWDAPDEMWAAMEAAFGAGP
jgi:hypothetical protein